MAILNRCQVRNRQWVSVLIPRVMCHPIIMLVPLMTLGCGPAGGTNQPASGPRTEVIPGSVKTEPEHDHADWWCREHGIPEEECSLCSAKVAKERKAKGDWCAEHDRAKSQCFICDPKLQEQFARKYRAKYGQEPPPIPNQK